MLYVNALRSNLIQICLITGLCTCVITDAIGQIVYTSSFTRKIDKAGIELYTPVEEWLHVYPLDRDSFMSYDLVLQNDINDFEVRYRIRPDNSRWRKIPNELEFKRLLSHIATNDTEANIHVMIADSSFAREHFDASTCRFVHFTPKAGYSEKPYATLITLKSDYDVAIDIILLHYNPTYDPKESFRNVRFD